MGNPETFITAPDAQVSSLEKVWTDQITTIVAHIALDPNNHLTPELKKQLDNARAESGDAQ